MDANCIGVDSYYLEEKAQELGYHPEIILAGRRLNDSMGEYVASQVVKLMIKKGITVNGASLLMLGITFKENCPDVRNTKIVDVVAALADYGIIVTIYDPWANPADVLHEYGLTTHNSFPLSLNKLKSVTLSAVEGQKYDTVVLGVAHKEFGLIDLAALQKENSVLYDVKGVLQGNVDGKL